MNADDRAWRAAAEISISADDQVRIAAIMTRAIIAAEREAEDRMRTRCADAIQSIANECEGEERIIRIDDVRRIVSLPLENAIP